MRTITFYSYKGGTGRTLLLANVAMLAARLGRDVVMVDADLEAPGLGYKLFADPPTRSTGLVGWLGARFAGADTPPLAPAIVDVPIDDPFMEGGRLRLLPAGRSPSIDYFEQFADLRLEERLSTGEAVDAFIDLQNQIASELVPEFLLIDARTGVSGVNRVATRVLADDVVALALNSPEQLEGTRSVLRALMPLTSLRTGEPLGLHVVLSRVAPRPVDAGPFELTDREREQIEQVRQFLDEPAEALATTLEVERLHLLHTDPRLAEGDFLTLARTRALDPSALHVDYLRLSDVLLGDIVSEVASSVIRAAPDSEQRETFARFFARQSDVATARSERLVVDPKGTARDGDNLARRVNRLRGLAAEDPVLSPDLADALRELATGFARVGDHARAIDALDEAIQILGELRAPSIEARRALASALNNRGISLGELGRHDEAARTTEEAVARWRQVAEIDPAQGERELARTLANLSVDYNNTARETEAVAALSEAVARFRLIAKDDRSSIGVLGRLLVRLGDLLRNQGELHDALRTADEAVDALSSAGTETPSEPPRDLAQAQRLRAELLGELGDLEAAIAAAEEAVSAWRAGVEHEPRLGLSLAIALSSLGPLYAEAGRWSAAAEVAGEALDWFRLAAVDEPDQLQTYLAAQLMILATCLYGSGARDRALVAAREGVGLWRAIASADESARVHLALALQQLSRNEAAVGLTESAVALAREAVDAARAGGDSTALAPAVEHLGGLLLDAGKPAHAELDEAVALRRTISDGSMTEQRALARTLTLRARGYGDGDPARLDDLRETVALLRGVAEQQQPSDVEELARSLMRLSESLEAHGQGEDAAAAADAAIALMRTIGDLDPERAINLATVLAGRSARLAKDADIEPAIELATEAVAILRPLVNAERAGASGLLVAGLGLLAALHDADDREHAEQLRSEAERVAGELLSPET